MNVRFRLFSRRPFACCGPGVFVLAMYLAPSPLQAEDVVLGVVHANFRSDELEGLDVTRDGSLLVGGAPIVMPDLGNEKEGFHAELPILMHRPGALDPFTSLPTIRLGPGEITEVVIVRDLGFFVANVRDDDLFARNQLLLIGTRGAVDRVDLPNSADGIGLSPNGQYIVVAGEKYEAIDIFTVESRRTRGALTRNLHLQLVTTIGREDFDPFFVGEEARLLEEDLEPESVTFHPDGSLAFVSLQEQSSVAVIDMETLSLVNVVHLPFGFLIDTSDEGQDPVFQAVGVEPDGMSVSPDGSFLMAANEADGDYPHLGGISIVDLRDGPLGIPEPITHCIFDVDPSLLDGSGVAMCPQLAPGQEPTAEETAAIRSLPRLDPNNTEMVNRAGRLVAAINIERPPEDEDRGSVLLVDASGALGGDLPPVITRVNVGVGPGARPEALKSTNDGRFLWVGLQRDGGTVARIELAE